MARIALVTTGGTIGSVVDETGLRVDPSERRIAREVEQAQQRLGVEVSIVSALNLNSEDCRPGDWAAILQAVEREAVSHETGCAPDGIVVTHGTDTLAYTAAALAGFATRWSTKVVLTGACIPPDQPGSDATINLLAALAFAAEPSPDHGAFVAFRSRGDNSRAHILAASAVKPLAFDDQYFSAAYGDTVATYAPDTGLTVPPPRSAPVPPGIEGAGALPNRQAIEEAAARVCFLPVFPGIDRAFVQRAVATSDVVVFDLYHCGTGPTVPGHDGFLAAVTELAASKLVLMGALPSRHIPTPYASSHMLADQGAVLLRDLQPHYLYTFAILSLAAGHGPESIRQQLSPWATHQK